MYQIIQNYRSGDLELADVPVPKCGTNSLLIRNVNSLISTGTEKSIIDLGKKSLLGKAKARPDLVKRFMEKAKKEGFIKTFQEALGRLDNPTPLGYSSAGVVVEIGKNVTKYNVGDKVACIGAGYASHAEYIVVPENLCCKIPENVDFEEASFGMLGIIALNGIRGAEISFGENVAVIGLGLLGLITVQLLNAYGCKVIGFDIDKNKLDVAKKVGIFKAFDNEEDFKNIVDKCTKGYGSDAVIITAATESEKPVNLAIDVARMKAKVVVVGVSDIHPSRNEMWHKEVELLVSKAGGPGVFDPFYENKGIDYPIGYVRWTENRNLEEFLRLINENRIDLRPLITHRVDIKNALDIYRDILKNIGFHIGVIIKYPYDKELTNLKEINIKERIKFYREVNNRSENINIILGVIGAGLFGKAILLPTLKKIKNIHLHTISTSSSANGYHVCKKFKFSYATTDYKEVVNNNDINAVLILTPHSKHKTMVIDSLAKGKHVFVEKPLCINEEELLEISNFYNKLDNKPILMVGYNRRFSVHSKKVFDFVKSRITPIMINYRINAGFVPSEHWVHFEEEGKGRIIGEICHFVDLVIYLVRRRPIKIYSERVGGDDNSIKNNDNVSILIKFQDGSVGNIFYSASGDRAFSRERIEVYSEGKTAIISDFRKTELFSNGKRKIFKTANQDLGYKKELENFINSIIGKEKLNLKYDEVFWSTLTVFKIIESISKGKSISIV